MYDQVEIIEIEPDCIYRNSQGNLIIITDLVKDVFKLAEKNFKKYPNRSYLSDEKRIEVKKAVNKVIIKWGLNPTNMLLGDILYLESMYKHKQSSLMN